MSYSPARGAGDPDAYGYPGEVKWVGEDKAIVTKVKDPSTLARAFDYPRSLDGDYDPRIDNVDEEDNNGKHI